MSYSAIVCMFFAVQISTTKGGHPRIPSPLVFVLVLNLDHSITHRGWLRTVECAHSPNGLYIPVLLNWTTMFNAYASGSDPKGSDCLLLLQCIIRTVQFHPWKVIVTLTASSQPYISSHGRMTGIHSNRLHKAQRVRVSRPPSVLRTQANSEYYWWFLSGEGACWGDAAASLHWMHDNNVCTRPDESSAIIYAEGVGHHDVVADFSDKTRFE